MFEEAHNNHTHYIASMLRSKVLVILDHSTYAALLFQVKELSTRIVSCKY